MDEVNIQKLKHFYGALNNENRLKIILLCQDKGLTVTQLSKRLKLNYNITSEYIGMLAKVGLVTRTRNANKTVTIRSLVKIKEDGTVNRI